MDSVAKYTMIATVLGAIFIFVPAVIISFGTVATVTHGWFMVTGLVVVHVAIVVFLGDLFVRGYYPRRREV